MAMVNLVLIVNDDDLKETGQLSTDIAKKYIEGKNSYGDSEVCGVRVKFEKKLARYVGMHCPKCDSTNVSGNVECKECGIIAIL